MTSTLSREHMQQARRHWVDKLSILEAAINKHRRKMLGIVPPPKHWTDDAATYRASIAMIDAALRGEATDA